MTPRITLRCGEFYGAFEARRTAGLFDLSTLWARSRVDPHTHTDAHFVFILKGVYASSAYEADDAGGPGTLIYNPPGTTHRDRFLSTEGRFFGLSIAAERLSELEQGARFAERAHRIVRPRTMAVALAAARSMRDSAPTSDRFLESLLLEIMCGVEQRPPRCGGTPPKWLSRAREMLRDEVQTSVTRIAGVLNVHPVHLARVFRHHLGMSPGEYARRCRIERATDRLLRTGESLAEVAAAAGYADQSHFNREFVHETGTSPGRFRAALG